MLLLVVQISRLRTDHVRSADLLPIRAIHAANGAVLPRTSSVAKSGALLSVRILH